MTETKRAKLAIWKAIVNRDRVSLQQACSDFEMLAWHRFAEDLFSFLINILSRGECLRMHGANYVLNIFQCNFKKLSKEQKEKLLVFIEGHYSLFVDRMAWFTISEILGENYCNQDAFKVLCSLRSTKRFQCRLFVPHGFEHTIKDSGNIPLSMKALRQLLEMREDRSKYVRYEAELSLARIKNHFTLGTNLAETSLVELVTSSRPGWSYEWESEKRRRMWEEAGVTSLPWDNYFGRVSWSTCCCGFTVEINFKFRDKQGGEPRVSWLRSTWRDFNRRLGIACGECGESHRPDWTKLVKKALKSAKRLPTFSGGSAGPS